jgi:CRP/FNR family transcriptional regulator
MDISINKKLESNYGYLFQKQLLDEIAHIAVVKTISEGELIIDLGEQIRFIPLIIDGAIKVLRENEHEQ